MKTTLKFAALNMLMVAPILSLTACGGGETSDKIKTEYDRIADDISDEYKRVENKLTDNEKSMAQTLESVFLPEESLDEFLDKLTPEGGKGGLYAGHFVELDDGDSNDIDIGAVYFDIAKEAAGSIDGRISYQQSPCQNNNTLATDTAIKIDNHLIGKLSGNLDTLAFLDVKYIKDLDISTPNILTTFSGQFNDAVLGKPWTGSFEYQDSLGGKSLSSGKEDCDVVYTLAQRANYAAYPLDYKLGDLDLTLEGIGTKAALNWQAPQDTGLTLVSQINVNKAESGANGYIINQILQPTDTTIFDPVVTDTATNYAFVVQVFDSSQRLIGFQAVIADLPEAK